MYINVTFNTHLIFLNWNLAIFLHQCVKINAVCYRTIIPISVYTESLKNLLSVYTFVCHQEQISWENEG